jgi:hypothetical protein
MKATCQLPSPNELEMQMHHSQNRTQQGNKKGSKIQFEIIRKQRIQNDHLKAKGDSVSILRHVE